jgi:hypothetical protein
MLIQILREMAATEGTLRLDEIASRLNMDASALEGMLAFWVSKGRVQMADGLDSTAVPCGSGCGDECTAAATCPLVGKIPRMFTVKK